MRVSTGQIKQLLEFDMFRENVGNAVQVLLRELQQRDPKDRKLRKTPNKGEKLVVDLDAAPRILDDWEVEEHQKGGQYEWDVTKVILFVSVNQQNGKEIEGHKLRKELKNRKVFNVNLLDFLLVNPHLIPEKWKDKYVYFWGTIYRSSDDDLCVRYLYWSVGHWDWHWCCLDGDWNGAHPAVAVPAS